MANRSDRNSVLPRQIKRMLALNSSGCAHRDGETRRAFIAAHKHAQEVHKRMLTQQDNTDRATDPTAETPSGG